MNLKNKTLELLKQRPRTLTYPIIEEKTGLDSNWLSAFGQNKIKDPSVNKVQKLYEFLTGESLVF